MAVEIEIPHFALPFQYVDGAAAEVEQDGPQDVAACVVAVLSYPLGSRPEAPEFGLAEQAFEQGGPHLEEIRATIAQWEPRADVELDLTDELLTNFMADVRVGLDPGSV